MTVNNILQSLPSNHLKDLSFVLKTTKTTLFVFIIRFFDKFLDVIIDNPLKKYFAIHINSNSHLNEMGKTPSKKIHMYKKISFHYIFISLEPSASAIVCICIMYYVCPLYTTTICSVLSVLCSLYVTVYVVQNIHQYLPGLLQKEPMAKTCVYVSEMQAWQDVQSQS